MYLTINYVCLFIPRRTMFSLSVMAPTEVGVLPEHLTHERHFNISADIDNASPDAINQLSFDNQGRQCFWHVERIRRGSQALNAVMFFISSTLQREAETGRVVKDFNMKSKFGKSICITSIPRRVKIWYQTFLGN